MPGSLASPQGPSSCSSCKSSAPVRCTATRSPSGIHLLSKEILQVEEGSLYPALQKILMKGWVTAAWGVSDTNRKVRFYQLTPSGKEQLAAETSEYDLATAAVQSVMRTN